MDGSPPATAAPDGTDAAKETSAPEARRERRRLRVPTSVVVTVVVALLSVWVAPAFTRQWDDRQKAHKLKADLVADMTAATANTLVESLKVSRRLTPAQVLRFSFQATPTLTPEKPTKRYPPAAKTAYRTLSDEWLLASIKIEARLRAYFPGRLVSEWRDYSDTVGKTFILTTNITGTTKRQLNELRSDLRMTQGEYDHYVNLLGNPTLANELRAYRQIVTALLLREQVLTDEILSAHPAGYSTTRRDLLRDLLP